MEALTERIKRLEKQDVKKLSDREQAIIDRHTASVPRGVGILQRAARIDAKKEIDTRQQQRAYAEQAPPEVIQPAKEMLTNLGDRQKVLETFRKLTPEQRQEALKLAPGIAQQLGDDRGGMVGRSLGAVSRGISHGVSQPIAELLGAGGTPEEIEYIRQLDAAASQEFSPARPGDPWYQSGPLQAAEMAPWMATVVGGAGVGRAIATGAAKPVAAQMATRAGLGRATLNAAGKAGELAGITAASFPPQYAQEVDQLKEIGMQDGTQLRLLAAGTAAITGLVEGIVPNPFKTGQVPLTEGAVKAARSYLWEAAKRAPGEMSEEYLQGVTSGLGKAVGSWLDENAEDKSVADAFKNGWEQAKEAALPMAFLLGVPAIGGAGLSAARAQRLQQAMAKGFVSSEDAKELGIAGKNRPERMANAQAELEQLSAPLETPPQDPASPPGALPPGPPQFPPSAPSGSSAVPPALPPTGQPPRLPGPAGTIPPTGQPPRIPGPTQPPLPTQGNPPLPVPSTPPSGTATPPTATPPGAAQPGQTLVGINSQGQQVFEDINGVRSVLDGNVRITEPVEIRPFRTPDGKIGYRPALSGERSPEFEVAPPAETKQEPAPEQSRPPKPTGAEQWDDQLKAWTRKNFVFDRKANGWRMKTAEEGFAPTQPEAPQPTEATQKPASGSSAAESKGVQSPAPTTQPGWEIVESDGGKLFRENQDPNLKPSQRLSTRVAVDPSENVLATKDRFGKPIPPEILAARQEFVDKAKPGAEFEIKGFPGQTNTVQDDGSILNTSDQGTKRVMGNVQSRANQVKPGDITWKETPRATPTPATTAIDAETKGAREKTATPKRKVFQGRGATPEQVYGKEAVEQGRAVPILGTAQYYAFNKDDAKAYGSVTELDEPTVKNTLVLKTDAQWRDLLSKAKTPHLDSMSREFYTEPGKIPEATKRMQDYIKSQGYDSVRVELQGDESKRLRTTFGHDQLVVFGSDAETKGAAATPKEATVDRNPAVPESKTETPTIEQLNEQEALIKQQLSGVPKDSPRRKQLLEELNNVRDKKIAILETKVGSSPEIKPGSVAEKARAAATDDPGHGVLFVPGDGVKATIEYEGKPTTVRVYAYDKQSGTFDVKHPKGFSITNVAPDRLSEPESKWSSETRAKLEAVPAFKGAKVETDEKAGTVKVKRPDGIETTIHFNADKELARIAQIKGRKPGTVHGAYISSRYKNNEFPLGHIYIHSEANHTNLLNHEVMHWLEDTGIVTAEEVAQYGGREPIAEKYGKWVELKQRKKDSVFQRIYDALEPVFSSQARFFEEVGARKAEPKMSPIGDKKLPSEMTDDEKDAEVDKLFKPKPEPPKTIDQLRKLTFDDVRDSEQTEGVGKNKGVTYRRKTYEVTSENGKQHRYKVTINDRDNKLAIEDLGITKEQQAADEIANYDSLKPEAKQKIIDIGMDDMLSYYQKYDVGLFIEGRTDGTRGTEKAVSITLGGATRAKVIAEAMGRSGDTTITWEDVYKFLRKQQENLSQDKKPSATPETGGSKRGGGAVMAVMTYDGTIYFDPTAKTHYDVIEKYGLDSSDIIDGGFIIDGKYKMAQSDGGYAATEGEPEQVATAKRFADEYNAKQGKTTQPSADQVNVDSGAESKVKADIAPTEADFDAEMEKLMAGLAEPESGLTKPPPSGKKNRPPQKSTGTKKPAKTPEEKSADDRARAAAKKEEAKRKMREAFDDVQAKPTSGFDPKVGIKVAQATKLYIEAGALDFRAFIRDLVADFGKAWVEGKAPYFESAWRTANKLKWVDSPTGNVTDVLTEIDNVDTTRDDNSEAMGEDTPEPDSKPEEGGATGEVPGNDQPTDTSARGDDEATGSGSTEDSGGNRDGISSPAGSLNNHQIAENPTWLEGGPVKKLNRNIDAITTMNRIEAEKRRATPSEQSIIAGYTGWGHLKQFFIRDSDLRAIKAIQGDKWNLNAFKTLDARTEEQIRDRGRRKGDSEEKIEAKIQREKANNKHRIRLATSMTPAEYAQARKSTRYSHYTDPAIARAMWGFIKDALPEAGKIRVLEPSEGSGMFWGTMPDAMFKRAEMHGVDMDPSSSRIAKHLYPSVRHLNVPFQQSPYPEGFFDVAVTNVPFNKNPVQDPSADFDDELSLHNYFFAKTASRLREGGIVAFITTHFTMDAGNAKQRSIITNQGLKFLGAVRLNQDAFGNVANTKVTTDIIVMQKVAPGSLKTNGTFDVAAMPMNAPRGEETAEITVHPYFQSKPGMVAGKITANGEMRGADPELTVESDMTPEETAQFISRALSKIQVDKQAFIDGQQHRKDMAEAQQGGTTFVPDHLKGLGIGRLAVDGTNLVVRTSEETMLIVKTEFSPTLKARAESWFEIRDALANLQQLQTRSDNPEAQIEEARKELNRVYDKFVGEFNAKKNDYSNYKPLNTTYNKSMFAADYMSAPVQALENTKLIPTGELDKDGKEKTRLRVEKASIFTERTEWPPEHRPKPKTVKEALAHSMFTNGGVDIEWIATTLDKSKAEVAKQMEEYAFEVPNDGGWEIKEVYLSGNIAKKLEIAEEAATKNPAFTRNVDALREVLPIPKTFDQLKVYPNSPFLPVDILREFVADTLGLGAFELYRNEQELGGGWRANYDRNKDVNQTTQNLEQYAVREGRRTRKVGFDLFLDMIAGKPTIILDRDADDRTYVNEAMTNLAKSKRLDLSRAFDAFIRRDQGRMDAVANEFNKLLSGYVKPSIPDWVVSFDGMSSNWKDLMRSYQKEAAAKIAMGGNTLLAHRVGYGKTLSGVAGIMEQRRLGVARKPLAVVPNHLTGQWAKAFADFYPSARVMAPTSKDFEKDNRQATMNRIMTGNWDAIIIPESSFKKLPMSSEYVEQFFQEQISQSIDAAERARAEEGGDPRTIAELEDVTERLRNQLAKYLAEAQKDPGPFFDEMGIDSLTVDEAHHYKNLPFYTQNTRVAGINPTGSQQAFDMLMKTDFINTLTGSRNVTFLTGTPIANSMTEAWVMMRYLMPEAMKDANVFAFDDWKNAFGEVVDRTRVNTIGTGFRTESRFQQFVNLDVLAKMFQQVADIQMINNDVQVPPLKGGKPQSIVVPASDAMKNFMLGLAARSANMPQDPSEDNMLNVMTIGAGAAIDFRLLDAAAMPSETSKITVAADEVAKIFDLTTPFKGTQIIWADRGVPKAAKKLTAEMKQLGAWMLEEVQNRPLTIEDIKTQWKKLRPTKNAGAELQRFMGMALQDMNYTTGSEDDETSYKVEVKDEPTVWVNEITDVDPNITEQASPPWNVYQQMKNELVARGVPAEKIAFIHDYKTAAQKVQLWEKMNNGDMRVLIGNTPRLGTGANIQVRLVAAHHLDAPWRPADVEQRDGRIIRSGNRVMTIGDKIGFAEETGVKLDGVIINRYVTEGSIDARYWDTNEMKASMLQDFWSGNPGVSIEELGATTLSMSDVKAAAVANPLLKRKIELEHEVGKLSEEYRGAVQSKTQSDSRLKEAKQEVPEAKKKLEAAKKRVAWWNDGKATLPDGETFGVEIDGEVLFRRDDIAKAIDRKLHAIGREVPLTVVNKDASDWAKQSSSNSSEPIELGKIFGKTITVSVDGGFRNPETGEVFGGNTWQEKTLAKELKDGSWERSYSNAMIRVDGIDGLARLGTTPQGFAARIRNFVDPGDTWVESHEKALASKEKSLAEIEKLVKSIPEPDSTELVKKQQELEQVSNEIGEEDDDQITYWVATEELERTLGKATLADQLGRVDSRETLLGYIIHPKDGKLSVFNRAGESRPPAHAMVWVEGENATIGYVPRDDKGVMGLPILKHRKQIGTIQHPEYGELFVYNHKEGDVTQQGKVWVESEDGTQSYGYQDKDLKVVMGVEMEGKVKVFSDWPADVKRRTDQWTESNESNDDDLSDDDGTITPSTRQSQYSNTRQSRTSRRRTPGEAPGIAAADIQKTAEEMFDVTVRQGGFSEKAAGIYKWMTRSSKSPPSPEVIRTTEEQYASLATLSHEIAHHIDQTVKVVKNMPVPVKTEVKRLDYEPQKARDFEGWAEFFRRYVTEPLIDVNGAMMPNTVIDAPQTTEWFEKIFLVQKPELAKNIKQFRAYAQQFANQSVFARIGTMIADRKPQDLRFKERWKQNGKRWLNRLKSNFLDKFHTLNWIQKEAKERGYKKVGIYDLTMAYFMSASSHATIAFEEGVRSLMTGKQIGKTKLWSLSRHLENDGEYKEATRYALARHTLFMDEVKPGFNTGVDVDDAQAWVEEAEAMGKKDRYEHFARELAQFNDDLIMMLVDAGALSSEEADKMIEYYRDANGDKYYFPLHRVSDLDSSDFAGTGAGFVNLGSPVRGRSRSGSGRQILDPVDATITRAIKFYGRAIQARQAHTLAATLDPKLGGVGGMGGLMDRIPAKRVVNQGTIEEILDTLVDSGTIEADQARAMRIAARIIDPANGGMASTADMDWFANKHQIVDWENNWSDMEDAAKTEPDALAVISLWRPDYTPNAQKRTVMIYDANGNKLMYQLDDDLYQVTTGMQDVQFNWFTNILREGQRYFKTGAVGASTGFGTANLIRDYFEFQGKANNVKGLKTLYKPWQMLGMYVAEKTRQSLVGKYVGKKVGLAQKPNDLLIRLYEELGGKLYSVIGYESESRSVYRRRKLGKSTMSKLGLSLMRPKETADNVLGTLQELIAISDAPPRLADAEAALEEHGFVIRNGKWFDTKAGQAVDHLPESARIAASIAISEATINFKRIGALGPYVEIFLPFSNAIAQATYRQYQQLSNLKSVGQDTPEGHKAKRLLVYLAALASTGAFYWMLRNDDDDYRNQDDWLRDGYWTWGANGKTYVRIPKPRDFAVVSNVVENVLDAYSHEDARETSDIMLRELGGRIPSGGGAIRGVGEAYIANYDYFRGRELEGDWMKDTPKQYRTSSYTSRMSDYLGKHLGKTLNTSPIQFEHILNSSTGGAYGRLNDLYDAAQDGRLGPEHIPFARGLLIDRHQTRPIGEFYEKRAELKELAATQEIENKEVAPEVADKLAYFGWISEVMTALRRDEAKLGKKRTFENEKYITGLARAALGYDEQESNPNPLTAKDLPEGVRNKIAEYRQLAVASAAERLSPRSAYKSDEAYADRASQIARAEAKFKSLSMPLDEAKQLLRQYWKEQHGSEFDGNMLKEALQSRLRKLEELFKAK